MKKFLSKKPVMIAFIAAAVAFLAFYIATLAWPVSYQLPYTQKENGVETTIQFKSDKKIHAKITEGKETEEFDYWVYRDGNLIFMVGSTEYMTEAQYDAAVKELKELKKADKKAYEETAVYKANAFKLESKFSDDSATNAGAIVLAVVGGVVELALIAGATMSILYRRKK